MSDLSGIFMYGKKSTGNMQLRRKYASSVIEHLKKLQ